MAGATQRLSPSVLNMVGFCYSSYNANHYSLDNNFNQDEAYLDVTVSRSLLYHRHYFFSALWETITTTKHYSA